MQLDFLVQAGHTNLGRPHYARDDIFDFKVLNQPGMKIILDI